MSSLSDLHTAIAKGWIAEARRLANELRDNGVNISSEIEYARKLRKIKGGSWNDVYEAVA